MIVQELKHINHSFFTSRFANKFLGDKRTIRIGNIISTLCPVNICDTGLSLISDESINFAIEIPDISNYAGVCVQQLFITNVANQLASKKYTDSDIEIINKDIIIKKEHLHAGIQQVDGIVSMSHIKQVNGAVLIYLGLHNKAGKDSAPRSFSLNLPQDVCYKFMDETNAMFLNLANNIFLNTAKM